MPRVTYIDTAGKETTLDIAEGTSVMQAAVLNGIDGITGNAAAPACARPATSMSGTTSRRRRR